MRFDDLDNDAERALWHGFGEGRLVHLGDGEPTADAFDLDAWQGDRTIRAVVIRALLLGAVEVQRGNVARVMITGARITGQLDVEGADRTVELALARCWLDERPSFNDAVVRGLSFFRCRLPGLDGTGVFVERDLSIRECRVDGPVRVPAAQIGGVLQMQGSTVSNPDGLAVNASRVGAGQGAFFSGLVTTGKFLLNGARVGGSFTLGDAVLNDPSGQALTANNMTVDDNFFAEGLQTNGEIRMHGARIAGRLLLDGARLRNDNGRALTAEGLVVERDVFCRNGFSADGEVRFWGARISGQVELGGRLSHGLRAERLSAADVITHSRLVVTGPVVLRDARVSGVIALDELEADHVDLSRLAAGTLRLGGAIRDWVDLSTAVVGTLDLRFSVLPPARLRGLTYNDLVSPHNDALALLAWIRNDPQGYDSQPYEQLARHFQSLGHDRDSRIVLLHKRRAGRRTRADWVHRLPRPLRPVLLFATRLPGWLFDALAGYGYLPGRALIWLTLSWLGGFLVFRSERIPKPSGSNDVNAALYSLDVLVPTSPFGLESQFSPRAGALAVWIALTIIGYALSAAVIPAIARGLNRTDSARG